MNLLGECCKMVGKEDIENLVGRELEDGTIIPNADGKLMIFCYEPLL